MTLTGDEYFYNVKGLMIPNDKMDESIFDDIDHFIDAAQPLLTELERNFRDEDLFCFKMNLESILGLLTSIYAKWLETDGEAILRAAKTDRFDICRAMTPRFIASVRTLSLDLQVAQANDKYKVRDEENLLGEYADIVNNMSAIGRLVKNGEYDRAAEMISYMSDKSDNETFGKILVHVNSKEQEQALGMAESVKEHFTKAISERDRTGGKLKKVLFVDDDPSVLVAGKELLGKFYQMFCVTSGALAFKVLEFQEIDLFIFLRQV